MKKSTKLEKEIESLRTQLYSALDRNDSSEEIFNLSIELDNKIIEHVKLKASKKSKSVATK